MSPEPSPAAVEVAGDPQAVRSHLELLRELVLRGLLGPVDVVMISRTRVQEIMDEAVQRGRITRDDADRLVLEVIARGRRETDAIVDDVEQRLDHALEQLVEVAAGAGRAARAAVDTARPGGQRARRRVRDSRAARALPGVRGAPAIDLEAATAREVIERLGELDPAALAQLREREEAGKARKTVLRAIDGRLAAVAPT